jgi:CheY-like chemotaxis protein
METQTQQRIFDPFFTTKSSGRGLGLAAAIGIVHAHRGALRVYSEVGKGTDFKVLFPYVEKQIEEAEPEKEDLSGWQGAGSVLVIDDDEIVLDVTERILRKFGFVAITVTTGEEALSALREDVSDVVAALLDVTMPEMASDNMMKQLREIKKDLPIILISGYNEQAATIGMSRSSYDGFVQKPFDANMLAKVLRSILAKE